MDAADRFTEMTHVLRVQTARDEQARSEHEAEARILAEMIAGRDKSLGELNG